MIANSIKQSSWSTLYNLGGQQLPSCFPQLFSVFDNSSSSNGALFTGRYNWLGLFLDFVFRNFLLYFFLFFKSSSRTLFMGRYKFFLFFLFCIFEFDNSGRSNRALFTDQNKLLHLFLATLLFRYRYEI